MTHFVETHYDELVERCRLKVGLRLVPMPTDVELEHGIPMFLRQLADRLAKKTHGADEIRATAVKHGGEMHVGGFTIAQVVHDYGDACQSITELAMERGLAVTTEDFRALNECLDNAIADAVTEFSHRRDLAVSAEGEELANERLGSLAHELQNYLNAAMICFEALKGGGVGVRGSTGALMTRSMIGMRDLLTNTLAGVRLDEGVVSREPIAVREFIEDIEVSSLMEAKARGLRLTVLPVADDVVVQGDRQILRSVVSNLVQNAMKFTRRESEVTVRTRATATHMLIEVEDECGGLPAEAAEQMLRPSAQGDGRETGSGGLGLAIARRGAEALGARLDVRDLPGKGCVFRLDLARRLVP